MSNMKNDLIATLLNATLVNTAYTGSSPLFLGLYTAAPTASAAGTEVTGGSYARGTITYPSTSGQTIANSGTLSFPVCTAAWGTLMGWAISSAVTSGSQIYFGTLTNVYMGTGMQYIVGTSQSTFSYS